MEGEGHRTSGILPHQIGEQRSCARRGGEIRARCTTMRHGTWPVPERPRDARGCSLRACAWSPEVPRRRPKRGRPAKPASCGFAGPTTTRKPWCSSNRVPLCQATLSFGLILLLEGAVPTPPLYLSKRRLNLSESPPRDRLRPRFSSPPRRARMAPEGLHVGPKA